MNNASCPDSPAVVVTGAASGIGRATVQRFLVENTPVIGIDVDRDGLDSLASACRDGRELLRTLECDVTSVSAVERCFSTIEAWSVTLRGLVTCAGANFSLNPLLATETEFDRAFDLNVKSVWSCVKYAIPLMQPDSAVVAVSSIHATRTTTGLFPYAATKSAVVGLVRSLALELAPRGVRVNCVAPGWTRSAITDRVFAEAGEPAAYRSMIDAIHPLGRIAEPEEIGDVIVFLCGGSASFITGAEFTVDGGIGALLPA